MKRFLAGVLIAGAIFATPAVAQDQGITIALVEYYALIRLEHTTEKVVARRDAGKRIRPLDISRLNSALRYLRQARCYADRETC